MSQYHTRPQYQSHIKLYLESVNGGNHKIPEINEQNRFICKCHDYLNKIDALDILGTLYPLLESSSLPSPILPPISISSVLTVTSLNISLEALLCLSVLLSFHSASVLQKSDIHELRLSWLRPFSSGPPNIVQMHSQHFQCQPLSSFRSDTVPR